jgi:hypothetical protein
MLKTIFNSGIATQGCMIVLKMEAGIWLTQKEVNPTLVWEGERILFK